MPVVDALINFQLYVRSVSSLRKTQILYRAKHLFLKSIVYKQNVFKSWYLKQQSDNESITLLHFNEKNFALRTDFESIRDGHFTFLNKTASFGNSIDWEAHSEEKLWRYNLHYFDYILDLAFQYKRSGNPEIYQLCRDLILDWIAHCEVATPTAWDAYPASLRVVNWIKAYTLLNVSSSNDEVLSRAMIRSIYVQTLFVEHNLEYHLLNNHLLENARALFIAGHFFQCSSARRWRDKGVEILSHGLNDNFLADGGHEERSPMYHQIMMDLYDDVLSVINQTEESRLADLPEKLACMQRWLVTVLHPDGQIPLLSDCAFGIASLPDAAGTETLTDGLTALPDSGYFTFRDLKKGHFLIFDAGPLGPDHQTAHGHCDMLSYELSLYGKRFIVDSGVSTYHGDIDWRSYYRSTRAHNTVVVDGEEQSEIWGNFRVARRAHVSGVQWSDGKSPDIDFVMASHDGYSRLKDAVNHHRSICWINRSFWIVSDHVSGHSKHAIESLIHFHPDAEVTNDSPDTNKLTIYIDGTCLNVIPWGFTDITSYFGEKNPLQGWYAPEFGVNIKNKVVGFQQKSVSGWSGYILSPHSEDLSCEFHPMDSSTGVLQVRTRTEEYTINIGQEEVTLEMRL